MIQRQGDWMETYTGKAFWPLDPLPGDVDIKDIAHALSMQCRFGGHSKIFYSVAEHSILVAEELAIAGYDKTIQLYGLLHDASEAYVCDVPRPLKEQIPNYREIEARVQNTIYEALGIPAPTEQQKTAVKVYDDNLLAYEGRVIMNDINNWTANFGRFYPLGRTSLGMNPEKAKKEFLKLFLTLKNDL